MRHLTRIAWLMGALVTATAMACSDSSPSNPDGTRNPGGPSRLIDTVTTGPTGSGTDTVKAHPDTISQAKPSSDARKLIGVVHAIGAKPDTSKYELVGGATVVLTLPEDSTQGVTGKEIARATSAADGTFSLGTFKPGVYLISVTPPQSSSYTGTHWGFLITEYSAPTVSLGVWLGRKE